MAPVNDNAQVSVIVPVYNMQEYIERCVRSIMNQTYTALEIILVNDGSTDRTAELCDQLAAEDSRIRVIHKANGGVSSARNVGLKAANGPYISWLDGDDWFEPDMIRELMTAMKKYHAQAALCNYENVRRSGQRMLRYGIKEDTLLGKREAMEWLLTCRLTQSLWGNVMPLSFYKDIVFPEGKLFEDVCNVYKLYEQAERIVIVNQNLLNRMYRDESISHEKTIRKRAQSCEAYMLRQKDIRRRWPELDDRFARSNYHILLWLREAVFRSAPGEFREYSGVIRETAAYFRQHTHTVLGDQAKLGKRMEYYFLTSGRRSGFYLSRLVAALHGQGSLLL